MLVIEEQMGALALDDQGIERRQNVHQPGGVFARFLFLRFLQYLRTRPMLLLACAFDGDQHQLVAANPLLDQATDRLLARRIEVTDRVQAHDPLRAQGAVEQVGGGLGRQGRLWRLVPAEMALNQFIGLEHAVALRDRKHAGIEGELQRAFRRLAARPQMLLLRQHVVFDITDGQRAVAPDQPHHLAHVCRADRTDPPMAFSLVQLHGRQEEAKVLGRHVRQSVRPVFEHALVDALGLTQIGAPVGRNAGVENMVVTALDDVDGVDLHIAEMFDRGSGRARALAERNQGVEPLRA